MKITYDLKNDFFKKINLLLGIEQHKKQLIRKPNRKILKGTTHTLISLGYTLLSFILFAVAVYTKQKALEDIFYFIFVFIFLYTLYYCLILIVTYFKYKKNFGKGILNINQDGIEDTYDNNTKVLVPWDKIELIVIKNNLLTICTKVANLVIIATIEDKDINKFITTCKKNKEDILIINKMEK